MRYWLIGLGLSSLVGLVHADVTPQNHISFPLEAEQWVTTDTAKVIININAIVNETQLAQAQPLMLAKLNQIAKGNWHITQFDRTTNQAGLTQLAVVAEIRLPANALGQLQSQAQKISQPGETFTLQNILFVPTLAETELARQQIRSQIYQAVQQELQRLIKIDPTQHYQVYRIDFNEQNVLTPQPLLMRTTAAANAGSPPLRMNEQLKMTATIDLATA